MGAGKRGLRAGNYRGGHRPATVPQGWQSVYPCADIAALCLSDKVVVMRGWLAVPCAAYLCVSWAGYPA